MKFTITLKDPDGVYDSIRDAADSSTGDAEGLSRSVFGELATMRRRNLERYCERWVKYGEYVTIEIDTEAGTATVMEA